MSSHVVTLASALAVLVNASSTGPAPWDPDRARAMFNESMLADTVGLAPVWSLAVRDSGRRAEVIANRFSDSPSPVRFPLDSVELRRFVVRGNRSRGEEVHMYPSVAVVPVRENGELTSTEVLWARPQDAPNEEPRHFAGTGPIPRDGSQYCLSRNGRYLLVLRSGAHAVNIRGETGRFGLLDFFDVSNPKRPRRIGNTLEADGPLHNGAVADDGSRIAVEILLPSKVGGLDSKVVALERRGRALSAPRVVTARSRDSGLLFEGSFLFVGMQRPPLPTFLAWSTTATVNLYDLRD